jgi:hypothetical protein
MGTISCTVELCELNEHDADYVRHMRITSDPEASHRVVAWWTGEDPTSAHIALTRDDQTVNLTARDAAFWAGTLAAGGLMLSTTSRRRGPAAVAVDLAAAAEVLFYLTPDGPPLDFGSRFLAMSVECVIGRYFDAAAVAR